MIQMITKEECDCFRCRKRKNKKKLTNAELWEKEWQRKEREMAIISELGVRAQMLEMRRQCHGEE